MGLKLKLKANEKVYINGALVQNGPTVAELQVLNRVPLLREKDILLEKDADSPCRKIYFVVQTLYFSPNDEGTIMHGLTQLCIEVIKAAPSTAVPVEKIIRLVAEKQHYSALKEAKKLIKYEEKLISHAKSAQ